MSGKIPMNDQLANAGVSYQKKSVYDAQLGSIESRRHRSSADNVTVDTTLHVFTSTERLKATFEQIIPWRQKD